MSKQHVVALIHTGAVVIGPISDVVRRELPDVQIINYLDDKIVAHLQDPDLAGDVAERVGLLAQAARLAGADVAMLTCSSISAVAAGASEQAGIPVLRIDEAMADAAVQVGPRIAVIATLSTTCEPTANLLRERAALIGADPSIDKIVVSEAFAALVAGDRPTHDRAIVQAIQVAAHRHDVIVLAQASMASAAESARVEVPVLTSVALGVERLGQWLAERG